MVRETLYRTSVTVTGGRRGGTAKSDDGRLDLKLDMPKEMGGSGGQGTNPEQLFAAGYAACFESAILFLARSEKLNVTQSHVKAPVGIGPRSIVDKADAIASLVLLALTSEPGT